MPDTDHPETDSSIPASESAALEAEQQAAAARRQELEDKAQAAIALANDAAIVADDRLHKLRDLQWITTSTAYDAEVWGAITTALAALPDDATHKQIALAQANAICQTKITIAARTFNDLGAVQRRALEASIEAARTKRDAEDAIDRAENKLSGTWAAAAMGFLAGGLVPALFMRSLKKKEG